MTADRPVGSDPAPAGRNPGDSPAPYRIEARSISRSFGPVRANADVSLAVRAATVHAIIGENGAGKSTLMRILYGLDRPDTGTILINGDEVELTGPRDAIRRGIGLVQQELAIIPELTLLENLVLGQEPRRGPAIDWKRALADATALADSVGTSIDWSTPASQTPIAIQQQVEILRLIFRGADVLILDEPTAVLAPAQADELLRFLGELRAAGRTILFISHKLDEVITAADTITVLRSGTTITSLQRGEATAESLAALIMGEGKAPAVRESTGEPGDVVLRVSALAALDDRGIERLAGVDLEVRAGEILGIAAVAGNGQDELAEVLIGLRRAARGSIELDGRVITSTSVRSRRKRGVGYVSADRKHEGLALSMSLSDNSIATVGLDKLGKRGWLGRSAVATHTNAVLERAAVRYGSAKDPASSLSGGNQQRVVIGRETLDQPRLLIASQPTRGVDVRGIGFIHDLIRMARDEGAAIVLFSEELDEIQELADRVVVLHRGAVTGELGRHPSRAQLGALMLGQGHTDSPHATTTERTDAP